MEYDRNLFGEIERFVKVRIAGKDYEVPDNLEMLRVFQFLDFHIDYARLCWNASCQRCYIGFKKGEKDVRSLACRVKSFEGMRVEKLPTAISDKSSS